MIQTTIRMPGELYQRLKNLAKSRGMTLNAYLISVLWNMIADAEKEAGG